MVVRAVDEDLLLLVETEEEPLEHPARTDGRVARPRVLPESATATYGVCCSSARVAAIVHGTASVCIAPRAYVHMGCPCTAHAHVWARFTHHSPGSASSMTRKPAFRQRPPDRIWALDFDREPEPGV